MPQIPSTPHPVLTLLQVFGIIQYPTDAQQRQVFMNSFGGLALAQSFAREIIDPAALNRDQKKQIANAPSLLSFYQAIDDAADGYGRDVGEIFLTVLALAEHTSSVASVNKAVDLQIRRRSHRGKPTVTRDHLMRKWSEHKSVSHFLGALRLGLVHTVAAIYGLGDTSRGDADIDAATFSERVEQLNLNDPTLGYRFLNWLADFANLAEELRLRAARTFAQGQKTQNRPLLANDEAWFFGPEFGFPRIDFCMIRLSREELEYLLS